MPHFGLMDADALGPGAASLQRARLHIRAGRRRLSQGKTSMGILTLYDAMLMAFQWYFHSPDRRKDLLYQNAEDTRDERKAFAILRRSGVLDDSFDFEEFDQLVERAVSEEISGFDHSAMLKGIEYVMTQLGVMPFDEDALPPEDPAAP